MAKSKTLSTNTNPHGVIEKQRPVSALETIARERRDARQ